MNDIEHIRATRVDESIATYQLLKMVLQRMTRNKKYTKDVQNKAMEELDATRAIIRSLIEQRDQAQASVSTERNTATEGVSKADETQVSSGRIL